MGNREITHIVNTNSLLKTQLIVRTKCSFLLSFERNTKKIKKHNFMKTLSKS